MKERETMESIEKLTKEAGDIMRAEGYSEKQIEDSVVTLTFMLHHEKNHVNSSRALFET